MGEWVKTLDRGGRREGRGREEKGEERRESEVKVKSPMKERKEREEKRWWWGGRLIKGE